MVEAAIAAALTHKTRLRRLAEALPADPDLLVSGRRMGRWRYSARLVCAVVVGMPLRGRAPSGRWVAGTGCGHGGRASANDITDSAIFAGQPTLDVILAVGMRAVQSYPLRTGGGRVLGMLSFHYHQTTPRRGNAELVAGCAAVVLARVLGEG